MDYRSRFGSRKTWGVGMLLASLAFLAGATPASAFDVPNFSVTPSTTQAGGHPNLTVQIDRTGADNEDIRDLYLDLPPGLIGNTTAVGACTDAQFNSDTCPPIARWVRLGDRRGRGSDAAADDGHDLQPRARADRARCDRDSAAPRDGHLATCTSGARSRLQPNGPNDVNLQNVVLNQPRQVFLLGVPIDITVNSLTLTLNARRHARAEHLLPDEPDELRHGDVEGEGRLLPQPGGD